MGPRTRTALLLTATLSGCVLFGTPGPPSGGDLSLGLPGGGGTSGGVWGFEDAGDGGPWDAWPPYGTPASPYPYPAPSGTSSCLHVVPGSGLALWCQAWIGSLPPSAQCPPDAFKGVVCPSVGVIAACVDPYVPNAALETTWHYGLPAGVTLTDLAVDCTATTGRIWWAP